MKENKLEIKLKDSDFETLLITCFFYVDEIYKLLEHLTKRPGTKPSFSDSEVITLKLTEQMFTDSEKAWHGFIRKNYRSLFPKLVSLSRYHRRSKSLFRLVELMRQVMFNSMGLDTEYWHIMDSIPVPVCLYARASRNTRFSEEFEVDKDTLYGYCASKKMKIYGFKLHMMDTLRGVPAHFVLAPAAYHDVDVAPELVETYRQGIGIGTDKGYVGLAKKLLDPGAVRLIIPPKKNQINTLTAFEKWFLAKYRRIIETAGSCLAEQFNLQYTRAKSKWGLISRVTAKLASFTLAVYLNFLMGQPLLNIKELVF
ncbi:MAG: IS982 family transposase [Saprospiraceae bacterium]|nr:IS982 family transposase [Saprospiraceae bacterium]